MLVVLGEDIEHENKRVCIILLDITRFYTVTSGGKNIALRWSSRPEWCQEASISVDCFGRGLSNLRIFLQVEDELVQMSTLNYFLEVSFEGPAMHDGVSLTTMKGTASCF